MGKAHYYVIKSHYLAKATYIHPAEDTEENTLLLCSISAPLVTLFQSGTSLRLQRDFTKFLNSVGTPVLLFDEGKPGFYCPSPCLLFNVSREKCI